MIEGGLGKTVGSAHAEWKAAVKCKIWNDGAAMWELSASARRASGSVPVKGFLLPVSF